MGFKFLIDKDIAEIRVQYKVNLAHVGLQVWRLVICLCHLDSKAMYPLLFDIFSTFVLLKSTVREESTWLSRTWDPDTWLW